MVRAIRHATLLSFAQRGAQWDGTWAGSARATAAAAERGGGGQTAQPDGGHGARGGVVGTHAGLGRVVLDGVVQLLGLVLQQQGVKFGVAGHPAEGGVEDVTQAVQVVTSAHAARDVLLALTHLLPKLILQGGALLHTHRQTST